MGSLVNHWTHLPEWRSGRRLWVFYLTFSGQSDLHKLVQRYQERLAGVDELDLVDHRWLHVTIQGIAFTDELDDEQVRAFEKAVTVAVAGYPRPVLTVEAPQLDHDALSMQVRPTQEICALRHDIRECVARTIGDDNLYQLPQPLVGFNPHISIAYANAAIANADEVLARLDPVEPPDLHIQVPSVSLIHLERENRRWYWNHERPLAFRSGKE
jgi:2'-5' RNA ligase superfamily